MTSARQTPKPPPGRTHVPAAAKLVKAKQRPMMKAPRAKPKGRGR